MAALETPQRTRTRGRIPGLVEIAWQVQRRGAMQFFMDQWRAQGDLTHLRMGRAKMVIPVHPDHVRHVLATGRDGFDKLRTWEGSRQLLLGDGLIASTGELWKRQRRLMASFFTPRSIEAYAPVIASASEALAARWDGLAGQTVDMPEEMMRVTATIILRSMFGMDVDEQRLRALEGDVAEAIYFTYRREMLPVKAPLAAPLPSHRRYRAARARINQLIHEVIARRRSQPQDRWPNDLLTKMMLVRDEETGQGMADSLVHDEVLGLFVAGHETTARTMAFFWWMLDANPQVAERLHAEVDAVIPSGQVPTLEHLRRLPYLTRTLKEVLRLYPPAPAMLRDPVFTQDLDGARLEPGSYVMLLSYLTHRHPAFWDDPERFEPDRFLPEREVAHHPFAYFPFGGGARICLGNSFAMLEASALTSLLTRRFEARLVPGHRPQVDLGGTLTVRNGLPMRIIRRLA